MISGGNGGGGKRANRKITPFRLSDSMMALAVDFDNISYPGMTHSIEFCRPIPNVIFDPNSTNPPRDSCGWFTRDLYSFPLNNCTYTTGNQRKFGASEMVLGLIRLDDYPRSGGSVIFTFYRANSTIMFEFTFNLPIPDPSWTYWWAAAYAVVGKFDRYACSMVDEILVPGTYLLRISTNWGRADINYTVVDSPPVTLTSITLPTVPAMTVGGTPVVINALCKDQAGNTLTCPTLTVSNSNTSVVSTTVSGGRITLTPVGAGTAYIYAYSSSGVVSNTVTATVTSLACTAPSVTLTIPL